MKQTRFQFMGTLFFYGFVFFLCFPLLSGQEDTPQSKNNFPFKNNPSFFTGKMVLWSGKTQVIPFRMLFSVKENVSFQLSSSNEEIVKVVKQPKILAGETIGYCRVRANQVGSALLQIKYASHVSNLKVQIKNSSITSTSDLRTPRISGITPGSFVWGTFNVGVELFAELSSEQSDNLSISLRLGEEKILKPSSQNRWHEGPFLSSLFKIDAATLKAGELSVVAVAEKNGKVIESKPVSIVVIHPKEEQIVAGECEDMVKGARPQRYGTQQPGVGFHPQASNRGFVLNYAANPALSIPFSAKENGIYQVMLTTRGDYAGGAFPTVAIYLDESNRPVTSTRLIDQKWHRIPLGFPFPLETGEHFLTLFFSNDFYARGLADRNLFLDRFELVQIDSPALQKARDTAEDSNKEPSMNSSMMASMERAATGSYSKIVFRMALERPLDGQQISGILIIKGGCFWLNMEKSEAPEITLFVNGEGISTQQAVDPTFWLHNSYLVAGANTIRLKATLPSGQIEWTPTHTVFLPEALNKEGFRRKFYRFGVLDKRWDKKIEEVLKHEGSVLAGQRVASLYSNRELTLNLPAELAGHYYLFLEAKGTSFKGPPIAKITLETNNKKQELAAVNVAGGAWAPRKAGIFSFKTGPKKLKVAFTNDLYVPKVGDRNLWINGFNLLEAPAEYDREKGIEVDQIPPRVLIDYPKKDHQIYGADVVVARVYDNNTIIAGDIYIDNQAQQMNVRPVANGAGRFIFPLLLRNLKPGKHSCFVRVRDYHGNVGESEEISFTVLEKAPKELSSYTRAVHLLNRFAYGPELEELADILIKGEEVWLRERLTRSFDSAGDQSAINNTKVIHPQDANLNHIQLRTIRHLLLTNNPARAHFVFWTQNHFSTWIRKTGALSKWQEYLAFSALGPASFGELLFASAQSPAMIYYLDQFRSFAYLLNENYAREIMELHSLGVNGGYSQTDVTTLAHLLNGWTVAEEAHESGIGFPLIRYFRYDPHLSKGQKRQIFGMEFDSVEPAMRYDRVLLALEMLSSHPSTAKYICQKLIEHYVAIPANESMVEELSYCFMETGGDLVEVLLKISQHPEFWKLHAASKLTTPVDFTIKIGRLCGSTAGGPVSGCLRNSGMDIFDRATPDGYPEENEAQANSNNLLQRWKFAKRMASSLGGLVPSPWYQANLKDVSIQQNIIDLLAIKLTGFPLSTTSNEAALSMFTATLDGNARQTILNVATFICQLPEVNFK